MEQSQADDRSRFHCSFSPCAILKGEVNLLHFLFRRALSRLLLIPPQAAWLLLARKLAYSTKQVAEGGFHGNIRVRAHGSQVLVALGNEDNRQPKNSLQATYKLGLFHNGKCIAYNSHIE